MRVSEHAHSVKPALDKLLKTRFFFRRDRSSSDIRRRGDKRAQNKNITRSVKRVTRGAPVARHLADEGRRQVYEVRHQRFFSPPFIAARVLVILSRRHLTTAGRFELLDR